MICGWRSVLLVFSSAVCRQSANGQAAPAPLLLHRPRQLSSCTADNSNASNSQSQALRVLEDDQHAIRTEDLPLPLWRVMQQLRAAGHTVLVVGGAVRDLLLGLTPKDYDLLTSGHLTEVKQLLPQPRIIGRTFPICQLAVDGVQIEISSMHTRTPFRLSSTAAAAAASPAAGGICGGAVPPDAAQILQAGPKAAAVAAAASAAMAAGQVGRHRRGKAPAPHQQHSWSAQTMRMQPKLRQQQQLQPRQLSWAAARRENALGRDFTVNCLLYDPFAGLLFDYVGGAADIQSKLLRCNGDAAERFSRDPACMLRAVRCAARAGLQIEPHTFAALQQHSHLVGNLNSHRLTAELVALLGYGAAAVSMQLLSQAQLLQHILPLHHAYMEDAQKQQQHSQQQVCGVPDHQQALTQLRSGQGSSSSSSSSSGASKVSDLSHPHQAAEACTSSQQLRQQTQQQQASSALGQLWLGQLHIGSSHHMPESWHLGGPSHQPKQQQQQHQEEFEQQCQQLQQQSNMLLRVLSALDQTVSVLQPAQPEVVLASLTALLLHVALTGAVQQLQLHVQQHKQQQKQQKQLQKLQALQALKQGQIQQQEELQQEHQQSLVGDQQECLPQGSQAISACVSSASALDTLSILFHPLPAARRIARPFSSSSSSSSLGSGSNCHSSVPVDSCSVQPLQSCVPHSIGSRLGDGLVEQLLQGGPVLECVQQLAVQIANQVCRQASLEGAMQDNPAHGIQLFGVHTPKLASDLLLDHLQLDGMPQTQASAECQTMLQQQQPASASNHTSSSSSSGRQRQQRSAAHHLDLWDEYAAALPRSNKQYRQLMKRQWDEQLQGVQAGFVGTVSADAMMLDAVDARMHPSRRGAAWLGGDAAPESSDDRGGGTNTSQQVMDRVLQTAAIDFLGLQQQLQKLQNRLSALSQSKGLK